MPVMPRPSTTGARNPPAQRTLGEALRHEAKRLRGISESPRLDCELLLAHTLGIQRADLFARSRETLNLAHANRFQELIEQRAEGRPVAQIIGRKEFFSLEFEITAEALTPRPESELLVEAASSYLESMGGRARCMELGTGGGAVAIALARQWPECRITATDICAAALELARRNAAKLCPGRIRFTQGSWYEAAGKQSRFDLIVANPPYVESRLCRLGPLRYEPRRALDGGSDGLRHLRAVIAGAPRHLSTGGMLAVEHGANQGGKVRKLMSAAGLARPFTRRDLAGHERVSAARKAEPEKERRTGS
ncbi:MAG: peptide chain release factor N(5)-glutamine methyltransferase [Gammaproteobacteria bacterium]|nr:peptide chain release factor N(5)-glutamine methyltransferase [Gammaproteobacteria bacterium]MCY4256088.1 peptide chain release factor N(5)-glutamine methyltransferase [Gammaproteobacteria bacterium]